MTIITFNFISHGNLGFHITGDSLTSLTFHKNVTNLNFWVASWMILLKSIDRLIVRPESLLHLGISSNQTYDFYGTIVITYQTNFVLDNSPSKPSSWESKQVYQLDAQSIHNTILIIIATDRLSLQEVKVHPD